MQNTILRPAISIIIPTYRGMHLLEKNLPTVLKCMEAYDELLVIDDASHDGTEEWFKSWKQSTIKKIQNAPTIRYIQNISNLRFAASVNKAVMQAEHTYIFLLNNDVSPKKDVLSILWNFWQSQEDPDQIFAIGCKEVEDEVIGGRNQLWFERGMFIHSRHPEMVSGLTAWASGGSALFDKHKWLELGGFDRQYYPAYWEDIDISFRAQQQGWITYFCNDAIVNHHHETTNQSVFGQQQIALMSWKNAYLFGWSHMNRSQWISHLLWMMYHLTITSYRTKGLPWLGLFKAVFQRLS